MRFLAFLFPILCAAPAAMSAPIAMGDVSFSLDLSASPAEEIDVGVSAVRAPDFVGSSGLSNATLNGSPGFVSFSPAPLPATPIAFATNQFLDADVTATGVGGGAAFGSYTYSADFRNSGNVVETVALSLSYSLLANADLDGFLGAVGAGSSIEVFLDSALIFSDTILFDATEGFAQVNDSFATTFFVDPTNDFSRTLDIVIGAGAQLTVDGVPPAVPLPASGLLLFLSLGGTITLRRMRAVPAG